MKKSNEEVLKLIGIVARNAVFLSANIKGESYFNSYKLDGYYFDGKKAKETFKGDWVELKSIPKSITKKKPQQQVNVRYELKEGFQETELTPKVIPMRDMDEYEAVHGLYTRKYDLEEEEFVEVPFELNIIEEVDGNFEIKRQDYDLKHTLLDRITTHPALLMNKPCTLTKNESFKIMREPIKANIDPRYATITSDYDFCLTVKKVIAITPEAYTVNVNASYPRRKPKYETRFNRNRTVTVYEAAPKPYQTYSVVEAFVGKDAEDLQKNIDSFLSELISKINEPFVECEHCKGNGVVLDAN